MEELSVPQRGSEGMPRALLSRKSRFLGFRVEGLGLNRTLGLRAYAAVMLV